MPIDEAKLGDGQRGNRLVSVSAEQATRSRSASTPTRTLLDQVRRTDHQHPEQGNERSPS